jgi:3-dehydrotetronate 4-kinase
MRMGVELAVLADDLTGGLIIASTLEAVGVRCPVATSVEALAGLPADAEAVVLARKIRLADPATARAEATAAARAFAAIGAARVFYKYCALFDSSAEGAIGPIADVLLAETGAPATIFCPSFVEHDVTVFEGRMFVGGVPLGETYKRFDPVLPMTNSNLVEVLAPQTRHRVGLLRHRDVAQGPAAIAAALDPDCPFHIADAIDPHDIAQLALAVLDWPLVTGGDSLPMALARAWRARDGRGETGSRGPLPKVDGHVAVLSGSCGVRTLEQLDVFAERHPTWRIDLAAEADDPGLVSRILDWAAPRLTDGPVAIATSGDPAAVTRAQARFGRDGAAERSDRIIADLAAGLFDRGVRRFVVAGGETSGQVIARLGLGLIDVAAFDDMLGGHCHADPVALVLKPGMFGGPDFLLAAVERLTA